MQTVVIERDVDQDRFILREQYKIILSQFVNYSKNQCFFHLLGETGARPSELVQANIEDINFEEKKIKRRISKAKQYYEAGQGPICKICNGDGFTPRYETCRRCKGTGSAKFRAVKY